jgi:hypothetical protein
MDPAYAQILRVDKHASEFSAGWPHATDRFWKSDPTYGFMTADQEDTVWLMWGMGPDIPNLPPAEILVEAAKKTINGIVLGSPIPGSRRATDGATQLLAQLGNLVFAIVTDHGAAVLMHVGASSVSTPSILPPDLSTVTLDTPPPNGYPGTYFSNQAVDGVTETSGWGEISEAQYLTELQALPAEANTITSTTLAENDLAAQAEFFSGMEGTSLFEQFQSAVTQLNQGFNQMLDSLSYTPHELDGLTEELFNAPGYGLESTGNFAASSTEVLWEAPVDIVTGTAADAAAATAEGAAVAADAAAATADAAAAAAAEAFGISAEAAAELAAEQLAAEAAQIAAEAAAEAAAEVAAELAAEVAVEVAAETTTELILEILIPILLCNVM